MREVFAAKLGTNAALAGQCEDFFLKLKIPESPPASGAGGGEVVEISCRGQLDGFQAGFRGGAADDNGNVIRRAGGGAEVLQMGIDECGKVKLIEHGGGGLVKEGFVGGAA